MRSIPTTLLLSPLMLLCTGQASAEQVAARVERIVDGQRFTLSKYVDEAGVVRGEIVDEQGRTVSEQALPRAKKQIVSAAVTQALKNLAAGSRLKINVALNLPTRSNGPSASAGAEVLGGLQQATVVNESAVALPDWERHEASLSAAETSARRAAAAARGQALRTWAARHGLGEQPGVLRSAASASDTVTLELGAAALKRLLASGDALIAGVDLYEEPKPEITQAMAATSISSSAHPNASTRGSGIGVYMTEGGCADPSRITNYTRLSGSETDHARNVGAIVRAVSPSSWLYCRSGSVLPLSTDLDGVGGNPAVYAITNSTGFNDTTSYNTTDRDWDNYIYNNNVPIFKSAGNEGAGTGNITSPGKGFNTIAVGNYNDANNTISGTSSFVDPEMGNEKPEIVAPGTNITAGGITMSGTSMAAPHAAGFAADMMSGLSVLKNRPYLLKANMVAAGTDVIAGGAEKVGSGGIDFASGHWNGYWQYYTGANSSFATFDSGDGASDGYITKKVNISNSWNKVRVALSWITRGTYTYAHKTEANPIGIDLDLSVYDPNGNYVGGSSSFNNPYEFVQFTPTVSGNYSFKIKRYANRDTASDLRIGLYVNYFN